MAKRTLEEELEYEEYYTLEMPEEEGEQGHVEEDVIRIVVKTKKKRIHTMKCTLCGERCTHLGRHAIRHLPWFWHAYTACWICQTQHTNKEVLQQHVRDQHNGKDDSVMFNGESRKEEWVELANGCLREITRLLELEYPQGLIDLSNTTLNPQHYRFTKFNASDIELCQAFISYNELSITEYSILTSTSTFDHLSLLHWKILLTLITKLTTEQQESIIKFTEKRDKLGLQVDRLVPKVMTSSCPVPVSLACMSLTR